MATSKLVENMSAHKHTMSDVLRFLHDPNSPELSFLVEYVQTLQANIDGETRSEDPEWFEGVQMSFVALCGFFFHLVKNCENRVDGMSFSLNGDVETIY